MTKIDDLIIENPNLHAAVSILIQGILQRKSSTNILYEWDKFRKAEHYKETTESDLPTT